MNTMLVPLLFAVIRPYVDQQGTSDGAVVTLGTLEVMRQPQVLVDKKVCHNNLIVDKKVGHNH